MDRVLNVILIIAATVAIYSTVMAFKEFDPHQVALDLLSIREGR